jgi:tetratricopeptide (TPR) repeat protein
MRLHAAALAASACLTACATTTGAHAPSSRNYADFLIGRVASMRDDHAAAADRYFAALARSPGDEVLIGGALASSLASGDVARARRAARMAPRAEAPARAHIVRAVDAIAARRWAQARSELADVEGPAADELIAHMLDVWARAGARESEGAAADLAQLSSVRPYGGLFLYQRAMVLDYLGRQEEALAVYDAAAQGGLWLPTGVGRHADLLARTGARDQALALLESEVNAANPGLAHARAQIEAGVVSTLPTLTPARGAAIGLYGLSAIFRQEHDTANALASLTLALMLDPDFDAVRLALARQQADLGHAASAQAVLAEVHPASPYYQSAASLGAWVLFDSGDKEGALARARELAQTHEAQAVRTLADMYRNLERFTEAEPLYSQLIEAQPNSWRHYFSRGAMRERLGRWPDAEADFRRALELSPDQPDVLNYLGYSWIDRGERLQEGLALVRRAANLRPTSGAIIDSLGWAYYKLGDYAQALDWLEMAVRLEPADATLNDHLGDAYWRLGRRIEARFQWQRALTLEPDDPAAIAAKLEHGLADAPPQDAAQ